MQSTWFLAALWIGLALAATLLSVVFGIATALSEIVVGIVAQLAIGAAAGTSMLGMDSEWIKFLSSTGAVMLTFLAGAELDPASFSTKVEESSAVGLVGFLAPFLGCTAVAYYILHWDARSSWLAGVALSTTSVAVVYAVMLEFGLNKTDFGKTLLASCFINDLGTVLALGLIFSPFTIKTGIFALGVILMMFFLPPLTSFFFRRFGGRPSELETKYILLFLFGFAGFAVWAGSEAVLPAYMIGMVLAGSVGKDHVLIRRLRTLTFGLLTPFYFIRAGSFVSIPALLAAPIALILLLLAKMASKFVAIYPVARIFKNPHNESVYTTLLMSTGLTFGSIAAMFGLTHGVIDVQKYSLLIGTIVLSAIVPTLIANAFYLPKHLIRNDNLNNSSEGGK